MILTFFWLVGGGEMFTMQSIEMFVCVRVWVGDAVGVWWKQGVKKRDAGRKEKKSESESSKKKKKSQKEKSQGNRQKKRRKGRKWAIASLQQLALVWVSFVIGGSSGGRSDELCVLPWRRGGREEERRGDGWRGGSGSLS